MVKIKDNRAGFQIVEDRQKQGQKLPGKMKALNSKAESIQDTLAFNNEDKKNPGFVIPFANALKA